MHPNDERKDVVFFAALSVSFLSVCRMSSLFCLQKECLLSWFVIVCCSIDKKNRCMRMEYLFLSMRKFFFIGSLTKLRISCSSLFVCSTESVLVVFSSLNRNILFKRNNRLSTKRFLSACFLFYCVSVSFEDAEAEREADGQRDGRAAEQRPVQAY